MAGELDDVQRAARDQFDRQSGRYGNRHILQNVDDVQAALERVEFRPGDLALDVAAGAGHTGLYLASRGFTVTLSDLSAAMLNQASAMAQERGLGVTTRIHPAESLPYPDGHFRLVSCRVAAHHFSDPEAFVRETARVLERGGFFILIDGSVEDGKPEAEEWIHQVEKARDPSHHRFLTPGRWRDLCEAAGLDVVECRLDPFQQPDLEWYFETAATSPDNRKRVLELVENAPPEARELFRLGREDGKIVWWWQRLTLVARKPR
jgi:ubiquinone/menaquinone biosynthesis C-methylase UbiE